jgi:LAO/AO transport system kinase
MTDSVEEWAEKIFTGDRRAIARAISAVESREESSSALLKRVFPKSGRAYVVGITGSPGTGKSTLVEKLARAYRSAGTQVGIIAVDPSSPFTGGAILGDRIRMQRLFTDQGVYIRSMATRGQLGGLAPTTHDVVTILDAAGCQTVLIETVGVGQDEVEVARLAEVTVLLVVPGMGDDIQTFKAGVMEIADVFVINKSDHPVADGVEQEVLALLSHARRDDPWRPPVLRTVATSGQGISELRQALDQFRAFGDRSDWKLGRQRERCRARLLDLLRQRLLEKIVAGSLTDSIDRHVDEVLERRRDPHSVVEDLIREVIRAR